MQEFQKHKTQFKRLVWIRIAESRLPNTSHDNEILSIASLQTKTTGTIAIHVLLSCTNHSQEMDEKARISSEESD